jgi:hypothetical protein
LVDHIRCIYRAVNVKGRFSWGRNEESLYSLAPLFAAHP